MGQTILGYSGLIVRIVQLYYSETKVRKCFEFLKSKVRKFSFGLQVKISLSSARSSWNWRRRVFSIKSGKKFIKIKE